MLVQPLLTWSLSDHFSKRDASFNCSLSFKLVAWLALYLKLRTGMEDMYTCFISPPFKLGICTLINLPFFGCPYVAIARFLWIQTTTLVCCPPPWWVLNTTITRFFRVVTRITMSKWVYRHFIFSYSATSAISLIAFSNIKHLYAPSQFLPPQTWHSLISLIRIPLKSDFCLM